jgi:hypothetical protein
MITTEEFQAKELHLSRKLEEIEHLQSDIKRLQLEKQEAEATGDFKQYFMTNVREKLL